MARTIARRRRPSDIESNRRDRREHILREAASLFARLGYEATSMGELTESMGINKGTLYYYYRSKSDILFDIIMYCANKTAEMVEKSDQGDPVATVKEVVKNFVAFRLAHLDMTVCYFQEEHLLPGILNAEQISSHRKVQRRYTHFFYDLVNSGIASGSFHLKDTVLTARLILRSFAAVHLWKDMDQDRLVKGMTQFSLNALGLQDPRKLAG